MMIVSDGVKRDCEIHGFRLKAGIGVGESMRVTHFAIFETCQQHPPTLCDCPLPEVVPMLCGATYDSSVLDEISPDQAGAPDLFCQTRLAQIIAESASDSAAGESSSETVVDGVAMESSEMVVDGEVIAVCDTPLPTQPDFATRGLSCLAHQTDWRAT